MTAPRSGAEHVDEGGSVSLELGLLAPVLILAILSAVQVGMYLHAVQVVETAAQDGLEAGRMSGGSLAAARASATQMLDDTGGVDGATVAASREFDEVSVDVAGVAPQVVPGLLWRVHARAVGRVETFVPETLR